MGVWLSVNRFVSVDKLSARWERGPSSLSCEVQCDTQLRARC